MGMRDEWRGGGSRPEGGQALPGQPDSSESPLRWPQWDPGRCGPGWWMGHGQAEGAASPQWRLLRGPRPPEMAGVMGEHWVSWGACFAAWGLEPARRCLPARFPEGRVKHRPGRPLAAAWGGSWGRVVSRGVWMQSPNTQDCTRTRSLYSHTARTPTHTHSPPSCFHGPPFSRPQRHTPGPGTWGTRGWGQPQADMLVSGRNPGVFLARITSPPASSPGRRVWARGART